MTLKGHKELSDQERAEVARLMRLHLETHPARVALLYGVNPQYVRQLWRERLMSELSTTQDALKALRERLPHWPHGPRRSAEA